MIWYRAVMLPKFAFFAILFAATALCVSTSHATDYNMIRGTPNHDWTNDGSHNHVPPCTESMPCVGDLLGTRGPDKIYGGKGWDWIGAKGGADVVYGGTWMDQAYGALGSDRIILGPGHDHAWGGDNDDYIAVSDSHDEVDNMEEIHGNDGYDTCKLDNDAGDKVVDCEVVTVLNDNGSKITFDPRNGVPPSVHVIVKMNDVKLN